MYIRVIGTIKDFGNRRHLAASQVRPISDHNEIFFHLLEAQYVHLLLRRGKPVRPSLLFARTLGGGEADVHGVIADDSTTTLVSALEEVLREGTPETTAWAGEATVEEVEACTTISSRSSRSFLPFVFHPCTRRSPRAIKLTSVGLMVKVYSARSCCSSPTTRPKKVCTSARLQRPSPAMRRTRFCAFLFLLSPHPSSSHSSTPQRVRSPKRT